MIVTWAKEAKHTYTCFFGFTLYWTTMPEKEPSVECTTPVGEQSLPKRKMEVPARKMMALLHGNFEEPFLVLPSARPPSSLGPAESGLRQSHPRLGCQPHANSMAKSYSPANQSGKQRKAPATACDGFLLFSLAFPCLPSLDLAFSLALPCFPFPLLSHFLAFPCCPLLSFALPCFALLCPCFSLLCLDVPCFPLFSLAFPCCPLLCPCFCLLCLAAPCFTLFSLASLALLSLAFPCFPLFSLVFPCCPLLSFALPFCARAFACFALLSCCLLLSPSSPSCWCFPLVSKMVATLSKLLPFHQPWKWTGGLAK